MIFDEDDDCNRWERVEFYDPLDLYKIGTDKGGLDNNAQADAAGDRGEFDIDFSGKGQLYIGGFDGRIHLLGAEWGALRIDQTAYSFQGFGGLYDRWKDQQRIQAQPVKPALIKYDDTDNNGFFDKIYYDLNGDKIFEDSVSLKSLGLDDRQPTFSIGSFNQKNAEEKFRSLTYAIWERAEGVIKVAEKYGISSEWYSFYKHPRTLHERYAYGFWLNFYLYMDLRDKFKNSDDKNMSF